MIDALPTGRNQFNLGVLIPGVHDGRRQRPAGRRRRRRPETRALIVHGSKPSAQRLTHERRVAEHDGRRRLGRRRGAERGRRAGNRRSIRRRSPPSSRPAASASTSSRRTAATPSAARRSSASPTTRCRATTSPTTCAPAASPRPTAIDKNWDFNPGVGGPIKRDRLWFFGTGRYQGAYVNAPACSSTRTPTTRTRGPTIADPTRPGVATRRSGPTTRSA